MVVTGHLWQQLELRDVESERIFILLELIRIDDVVYWQ